MMASIFTVPVEAASNTSTADIDAAEIRRAMTLFGAHEKLVEIRAVFGERRKARGRFHPGTDLDAFVETARMFSGEGATSIYFTINPVPTEPAKLTTDNDVLHRQLLFIDVDALTPDAHSNSSEPEHEAAREMALAVREALATEGWPTPILADSGNGWHLYYWIDLPADEPTRELISAFLKRLKTKFDGGGKIDPAVSNAGRISKLPGTWARKGLDSPDRPHRQARLLWVPEEKELVSPEQIGAFLAATTEKTHKANGTVPPFSALKPRVNASGSDSAYARKALADECARMAMTSSGGLNTQLFKSGAACGNFVPHLLSEAEVFDCLLAAAHTAGCDNPAKDEDTLRRGIHQGMETPRYAPKPAPVSAPPSATEANGVLERVTITAIEITPRKVEFLWPGRIPANKLTTFAGVGGLGKTFSLCDIAARLSTGAPWPDDPDSAAPKGRSLIISGEDDADDTLVPRLIGMGADLNRVSFLTIKALDHFTLQQLPLLERALEEMRGECRFLAIDPPTAYLGGIDDHKNAELRQLLTPLKSFAHKHNVAIVFNTHITKSGGVKVEAMMRVMGSVAWVNAVRAAHLFARDPDDKDRRLFLCMKMNVAKEKRGLAYRLVGEPGEDAGRLEWMGEVDTSADDAINAGGKQSRGVVASRWLIERFRENLEWRSDDLIEAGRQNGVSRNALFEAKDRLCLPKARKTTHTNGDTCWVWWVPADWPHFQASVKPEAAGPDETPF
jgi:hypothetical protein